MPDIVLNINKLNETYCQVTSENRGVLRSIADHFTVESGADFFAKRNVPGWDGKLRLFRGFNQSMYIGLIPRLFKFMDENFTDGTKKNYDVVWNQDDFYGHQYDLSVEDCNNIIEQLDIHSDGVKIFPREHQLAALYFVLRSTCRGIVISPTGSGKSYIIYVLIRFLQSMRLKTLLVVPNISLIQQMYSDFKDYSSNDKSWNVKNEISLLTGSSKKATTDISIANWQAIYKQGQAYFQDFQAVVVDEVHSAQADSLKGILEKCTEAKYRYGFTGTMQDTACHAMVIEGLFGPVHKGVTSKQLQNAGVLCPLDIKMIFLQYNKRSRHICRGKTYQEEVEYVSTHPSKRAFVTALAASRKGNVLVLVHLVEKHLNPLYKDMKNKIPGKKVYRITGSTTAEDREKIRSIMENNDDCILIATYGTCSTGVNIKNLHHIIFASAFKSKIRVLQSIGRELRVKEGKKKAVLWDLVDDLSLTTSRNGRTINNYLMRHALQRMQKYKEEEFPYEIMEKKIEKEEVE